MPRADGPAIRPASAADIPAIAAIYDAAVATGTASFELEPPGAAEMRRRFEKLVAAGYPYLVAEADGAIAGYAYAGLYRERIAYRDTVENSVYVRGDMHGRGVGRTLLAALVAASADRGYRQMVAVIGDSANTASIALHAGQGFTLVGTFRAVGWKHGRWLDTVLMQRPLGPGDTHPPTRP